MRGCPLRAGAGRRRGYAGRYDDSRRCDAYSGRAEINIVCRPSGRVVGPAVAQACFFLPADSAVLSVFAASLFAPSFFPSSVFLLPARISHCPCFSLSVSPSARISPALSGRPPSSVFRLVFLLSFLVFPFIVHRSPLVVRRPLRRPSSSACRLLSVARPAAPLSAAVRSGSRLLYPRNPGLRVFGSCLPCRVPSVGLSAKMPPPSVPWSPRRF